MIPVGRILNACNSVTAKGWTLWKGTTINPNTRTCCPLGAVAIVEGWEFSGPSEIAMRIGMNHSEKEGFIAGFDTGRPPWESCDYEAAALGKNIAKIYGAR